MRLLEPLILRYPLIIALLAAFGCTDGSTPIDNPDESASSEVAPALQNGSFEEGLTGWTLTGDADAFSVFEDGVYGDRWSVSTHHVGPDGKPVPAVGSAYQDFVVPMDAAAIRFAIHGGHGTVRLLEGDRVIYQVGGMANNEHRIPVSWGLLRHRGKRLRLTIDDGKADGDWAFISVSGFDVLRDVPCPLENADFSDGLNGWERRGDGDRFVWFRDGAVGNRWSITTAAKEGRRPRDAAKGALYQEFDVPEDALAMRFVVHGGNRAFVRLWKGDILAEEVSGRNSNEDRVLVNWDLRPHRGEKMRIAVEDHVSEGGWAFIGSTGFDVITERNGP